MKNLFLVIVVFFASTQVNAQKLTPKFLEGSWETEFHNVEFKVVNKKEIKITITIKDSKENVEVVKYKIHDNALYFETYYAKSNWRSRNKMIIIDNNTMVADVFSDSRDILIYNRK